MPIVKPLIIGRRFLSTIGAGTGAGATFEIAATEFMDDAGASATAFPGSYSYYNLYLNGLLQTGDVSSVTTTSLSIPDGDTLDDLTPVIIEFIIT